MVDYRRGKYLVVKSNAKLIKCIAFDSKFSLNFQLHGSNLSQCSRTTLLKYVFLSWHFSTALLTCLQSAAIKIREIEKGLSRLLYSASVADYRDPSVRERKKVYCGI